MTFTLRAVTGKEFIGRDKEKNEILKEWKSNSTNGFALYGMRRVGKTSLLLECIEEIKKNKKYVPIFFSVTDIPDDTIESFVKYLYIEILEQYKKHFGISYKIKHLLEGSYEFVKELLSQVEVKFDLMSEINFILKLNEKSQDLNVLMDRAFLLSEKLAKETKTKCILVIDEFPEIMRLKYKGSKIGKQVIWKIREIIQQNYKHTCLNISGSIKKTMEMVFIEHESPFYMQFLSMEITPFEKKEVEKLIKKEIKNISQDAINELYNFTKGIAFYCQYVGIRLRDKKQITKKDIEEATDYFLKEEGNFIYRELFESLANNEKKIVRFLATETNIVKEMAKKGRMQSGSVVMTLNYLEEKAIVSKLGEGIYDLQDPIFKKWLKIKFTH